MYLMITPICNCCIHCLVTLDYQFVDPEIVVESAMCDALKVFGEQPNIDTILYIKCDFF